MKRLLILALIIPQFTYANNCHALKETRIRMNTAAFNFLNANTTRTAEGGPFLIRKIKKCSKGKCDIVKGNREYDTILKYEPDHPDALDIGYVRYPLMDTKKEWATVNSRAHHLVLLAEKEACKSKLSKTKEGSFYEINYKRDVVKSDRLLFSGDQLKSWETEYRDGTTNIVSF